MGNWMMGRLWVEICLTNQVSVPEDAEREEGDADDNDNGHAAGPFAVSGKCPERSCYKKESYNADDDSLEKDPAVVGWLRFVGATLFRFGLTDHSFRVARL